MLTIKPLPYVEQTFQGKDPLGNDGRVNGPSSNDLQKLLSQCIIETVARKAAKDHGVNETVSILVFLDQFGFAIRCRRPQLCLPCQRGASGVVGTKG